LALKAWTWFAAKDRRFPKPHLNSSAIYKSPFLDAFTHVRGSEALKAHLNVSLGQRPRAIVNYDPSAEGAIHPVGE
jgi:hypothetical protein